MRLEKGRDCLVFNHGKDSSGIIKESFTFAHEVDDDIGIKKYVHRALSSHISSSSLSKSKSLGNGPHVIAITFADGL